MKKTHKIISVLLVLAMMLTMAPLSLTASAATPTPYDGVPVTPQKISSGNYARLGLTSSNWSQFKDYYAIRNAKELYGFADIVKNTLAEKTINLNAVLLQDIVINANGGNTYDWRPLYGTGNHRDYRGIIDGNGHYISGIYCTQVAYMVGSNDSVSGLIGGFEGTVKNLIIKDSTFAPNQHLGMYGAIGAITGYPQTCTIINCRVENTKISSIDNYGQLGGIAGYGNGQGSTIKNCASINVTFSGGGDNAPISNYAPFSDCYTSASDSHTCSNISVEHKEVKATCEYPGLSNYKYCLVCGNITSGTKTETPATGHTWTPATCQAPKTCSSCGLTEGSAVTHKYTTYTLSSNAMCGTNAQETASCDYGCGTTDTREISGTALVHSLTYSASGNTITAVCANGENCPNPQSTLKILAPADLYADGITAKEATVENNLVDTSVAVGEITYSTADGSAPKTAGTYTASVTVGGATASVEYTLVKRNAAADMFVFTAVANLVYDGTAKYAAVDVSPEITGMGAVTVKYYKDGVETDPINAGTYTVKVSTAESDKYYAINDVEIGSFTIKKIAITVTATDMSKTYGEADPTLAYTLSNEAFASEIVGELARTSGENVGVYEIGQGTLTNDNNPNFEITFAAALFTIEVDASGIDGITPLNVKSSDKAKIEYVYNQLDNAVTDLADDAKKAEWNNLKAECAEMLAVISGTAEEIKRITDAVNAYDINTVTSDDVPALVQLAQDTDALLSTDNLTAEEIEALVQTGKDIQALISRCGRISAQIGDIIDRMLAYDEATVKSSDKVDIEKLVADIKDLTDGQNITAAEREYLVNADAECDKLLAKIAKTKSEYDRVIEAANGYDEATVTSADMDALVQLDNDIYDLAVTENVTAEEKENLQAAHDKVFALINKLVGISNEIKRIIEAVDKYVFESVKTSDKADIQQLIADIKALTDTQNITADERTLLETADETCDKLVAKIDETVAEINRIDQATNAYDEATVTSADKEDIEQLIADIKALTDGDNITESEREQLNGNDAVLDALLAKINATADEIARIEDAVNSYDEATVKSTDKADLEQLVDDIKALTDATNITEDERAKLGNLDATLDSLIKKIDDTAAEIERIDEAVNGYDAETVTSDDVPELSKLIDDIKALTDGQNITDDEKAALEADDATVDDLVEKLAEVAEEIKKVDEAVKSYDIDTVKSTDKEDLEQLKEDVQALIDSTNTTENEKTALEEMINDIEGLENRIEEIEKQLEDISNFEETFDPETVTSDDMAAIEEKIAEIEAVNPDNLTDEQKAEYVEIKAELNSLIDKIRKTVNKVEAVEYRLNMFLEERITIFWEEDINELIAEIDILLEDENMGENEKATLNEYKAEAEKLIDVINTPEEYFSMRLFYFFWDAIQWISNHIASIFNSLLNLTK